MVTQTYPGSYYNGDSGFEAPQLSVDPNITFMRESIGITLTLAASGRTNGGGQLHPNSGSVHYSGITYGANDAQPHMYANLCMELARTPSFDDEDGVPLSWGECGTRSSPEINLQRFKFGYDWTSSHNQV